MLLIPLLTLVFIIWILFYIFSYPRYPSQNHYNGNNNTGYSLDRALEILRERYARGDISTEEYQKIKNNLES